MVTNTTSHHPVAHLSTEALNARARKAAATLAKACISPPRPKALAFKAARLGAHTSATSSCSRRRRSARSA
jgi:hypothetical protein